MMNPSLNRVRVEHKIEEPIRKTDGEKDLRVIVYRKLDPEDEVNSIARERRQL